MEIYVHPTCSSCAKAVSLLSSGGMTVERRDYFGHPFERAELAALLDRAGIGPREMLATRSRAYKDLGLAARELGDDETLDLMVQEPTLLRRPLVIGKGGAVVGFNRPALEALIAAER